MTHALHFDGAYIGEAESIEVRPMTAKERRGGRIRSVLAERVLVPVRDKATQEVTDFAVALLPTYTHQLIGELFVLGLP